MKSALLVVLTFVVTFIVGVDAEPEVKLLDNGNLSSTKISESFAGRGIAVTITSGGGEKRYESLYIPPFKGETVLRLSEGSAAAASTVTEELLLAADTPFGASAFEAPFTRRPGTVQLVIHLFSHPLPMPIQFFLNLQWSFRTS